MATSANFIAVYIVQMYYAKKKFFLCKKYSSWPIGSKVYVVHRNRVFFKAQIFKLIWNLRTIFWLRSTSSQLLSEPTDPLGIQSLQTSDLWLHLSASWGLLCAPHELECTSWYSGDSLLKRMMLNRYYLFG